MRRITPLVVALLLAACDDSGQPVASVDTVGIGSLPAAVATTAVETVPTTAVDTVPTTDEPVESTDVTTTTAPPEATAFVDLLANLVEDEPAPAVAASTLTDDTGRLRMDVPEQWSDQRTQPSRLTDGTETPALAASPDLTAFLDGFETPGITALVVADGPAGALGAYRFEESCTLGRRGSYVGDGLPGRYVVWESCGGTFNDIVTVAVQEPAADESVLLLVQVVGAADLVALDRALASLTLRR